MILLPNFARKCGMRMKVEKVWHTDSAICIRTDDGREAQELFSDYPRLRYATREQLERFETDGYGIHWPDLDEDLSFECFFDKQSTTQLYRLFMAHPELNVSAVARRMGISQSLMAQYISGKKKPGRSRMEMIYDTIRAVGKELLTV